MVTFVRKEKVKLTRWKKNLKFQRQLETQKDNNEEKGFKKIIKKSTRRSILISEIVFFSGFFLVLTFSDFGSDSVVILDAEAKLSSSPFFVENLEIDSIDTRKPWGLVGTTMNVKILFPDNISPEKIKAVKDAITSTKKIKVKDSISQKKSKISSSTYYLGWKGALNSVANQNDSTKYQIPLEFNLRYSDSLEGDVIITFSNIKDPSGNTGITKSVADENKIQKSYITIFDAQNLTEENLATITRHEFGHALGLGHSTSSEDLMAPTIDMTNTYISDCHIDAIIDLYNRNLSGATPCEK